MNTMLIRLLASLVICVSAPVLPIVAQEAHWAQYDLSLMQSPKNDYPFEECFARAAAKYALPELLLAAVARGESRFDKDAVSSANALGLMQILWPGTAQHLGIGEREKLFEPCVNVDAGARYLKEMLDRYNGNVHRALAAYNYGPGRITRQGSIPQGADWYSRYIYHHLETLRSGKHSGKAGELELNVFSRPWRAEAYYNAVRRISAELSTDWYRTDAGEYRIVLRYGSGAERVRALKLLEAGGIYYD